MVGLLADKDVPSTVYVLFLKKNIMDKAPPSKMIITAHIFQH